MDRSTRSMDRVGEGEKVTVARILFDTLRSHCFELGIREGTALDGRRGDPGRVVVVNGSGDPVSCERRLARFIQVIDSPRA